MARGTLAFLVDSGVVLRMLGASTRERPLIGIPAGLWLIAGTVLGTHASRSDPDCGAEGEQHIQRRRVSQSLQARLLAFDTATGLELPRWDAVENGLRR